MSSNTYGIPWTKQEVALLYRCLDESMTLDEIAKQFQYKSKTQNINIRSRAAVRRKISRLTKSTTNILKRTTTTRKVAPSTKTQELKDFEKKKEVFEELWLKHKPKGFMFKQRGLPEKAEYKILSLSDLHCPIVDSDMLYSILEKEKDADLVVINGDLLDGYIFSTYQKSKTLAAVDEYRSAFAIVKYIAERFPRVVLTKGNHDDRVQRYLADKLIPKEASALFQPDLLARIANGEEVDEYGKLVKKHDFSNVTYERSHSWYVRVGNAIFAHPHFKITSAPGMGVRKAAQQFEKIYTDGEIDCIVIGHTHALYQGVVKNQLLIEQGCLTAFTPYSWSAKSAYESSPQLGYAVVYQDVEGNTDYNKSQFVYCGKTTPKQKVSIS